MTPEIAEQGPPWTLHEGDCLDVLPTLPPASFDAIITDPPFFMPVVHYVSTVNHGRTWADASVLRGWWARVADEFKRLVKPTGHVITFCDRVSYAAFLPAFYDRFSKVDSLVWDKVSPGLGSPWRHQHELILAACNGGLNAYKASKGGEVDIIKARPTPSSKREHPVQKPRELLMALVDATVPPGGSVLDPFAGSGTTLEAAVMRGCTAVGVEADAKYCRLIRRRLEGIQGVFE